MVIGSAPRTARSRPHATRRQGAALGAALVLALGLTACATTVEGTASANSAALQRAATSGASDSASESPSTSASADPTEAVDTRPAEPTTSEPVAPVDPSPASSSESAALPDPSSGAGAGNTFEYGGFGDVFTWDDGLALTVTDLKEFEPSRYAAVDGATHYVRFTVTLTNDTGASFDPTMTMVDVLSAEKQGIQVYDSEAGLSSRPSATLLDGKSISFDIGFAVADPASVLAVISVDFDRESGFFATPAAQQVSSAPGPGNPATGAQAAFGQYLVWPDGIAISVSAPEPYTPSEYAAGGSEPASILFNIRITNGSSEPFEAQRIYETLQSGSREATRIFDSAGGLTTLPSVTLPPGHSLQYGTAFGITDPNDLVLEISRGYEFDSAVFVK